MNMEKIDPYKHKEKYEAWKEKVKQGIPGINKTNSLVLKLDLTEFTSSFMYPFFQSTLSKIGSIILFLVSFSDKLTINN